MATTTSEMSRIIAPSEIGSIVLDDVPWAVYEALRDAHANRHIRMTYSDGRLELMSPLYRHEKYGGRLGKVVLAVTAVLAIPCLESRATTFRRKGKGKKEGKGKEADTSFYIANEAKVRDHDTIDLRRDPPPDLAIEVDETTDSESSLPIYAALRVPEVWRFDAGERTLWFGSLTEGGAYVECERSLSLPMLTPERVLDWLDRAEGLSESEWFMRLLDWVRAELSPGGEGR